MQSLKAEYLTMMKYISGSSKINVKNKPEQHGIISGI